MLLVEIVPFVIAAFFIFYWWQFSYWKRKNVPFVPPLIPFGSTGNPLKFKLPSCLRIHPHYEFCKSRGLKHCGGWLTWSPIYVPIDPDIIKRIMVSEWESFLSRGFFGNFDNDPLTAMVMILSGQSWRRIRTLLTPTFTSGKMKSMFPVLIKCNSQMLNVLHKLDHSGPINIKELAYCLTTDVTCACSFGLDCNTCENPNEEIRTYVKTVLKFNRIRAIKHFLTLSLPKLCSILNIRQVPQDVSDFFIGTIKKAIEFRKTNNFNRKDLLQSLIEMLDEKKITFNELAAQAFAFYVAGVETSACTITFCLFELAQHHDIQERAREEVNDVVAKNNGEITYDSISEMTYLRQVMDETFRMYPPVPVTIRRCTKDYVEPDTGLKIDEGTLVYILIRSLHYDSDYFPNPETFDPERFHIENKPLIKPFTYLPFGDGPRNCLGARFGLIQTMLAVASILRNYKFKLHSKTQLPIRYNPHNFTLDLETDFYLAMERIPM